MTPKVFFLVTIDTECDKGAKWHIQYPLSFNNIYEGVPRVLSPLFNEYNIRPTYLLSPEILYDDQSMQVFLKEKNVELGTHLHAEFIAPEMIEKPTSTFLTQVELKKEIEAEKLKNLTDLFKEKTGKKPLSFRAGRYGMSKFTLEILESLGYIVDSSIMPYRKYRFSNDRYVDYWNAYLQPYYPSKENALKNGKMSIMEVPLTSVTPLVYKYSPVFMKFLNPNNSTIKNKILTRLNLKDNTHHYLTPYKQPLADLKCLSNFVVNRFRNNKVVILNMMFHSNEVYPNASPYTQTWEDVNAYSNSMAEYFQYLKKTYNAESIGLSDVKGVFI
ncbi:MAG: hypothetical protein JSS96_07445 [Bacteroidetes bacterium]|nr:hypothetical protein [Bacteroidota bacterium]